MYRVFSQMLKSFDRQDLEDLYKLVKAKYGSIRPMEDLDLILYGYLKTMFDPHVKDTIWRNQQDYRVLDWKIYDSCGVHSLRMQHVYIHMLVEKRYPLTPATITDMLNKKLQCDHFSEMLSMNKLEILKKNIKFKGGLLGLKDFMMILELLLLSTTSVKLVPLVKIEENILSSYYCLYTVNATGKLLLLVLKVNAASTKVITAQRLRLLKEFLLSKKG
ncbi:hypothetical protein Tco_1004397 [Tanacetum coccineum]|uniref:Uncharacterized protein n=1 Tax=Tanacetum coccineum TaxID=301880 RepID=A0ABQ5FCS5_9ASTR